MANPPLPEARRKEYVIYDERALLGSTDDAAVLEACGSLAEVRRTTWDGTRDPLGVVVEYDVIPRDGRNWLENECILGTVPDVKRQRRGSGGTDATQRPSPNGCHRKSEQPEPSPPPPSVPGAEDRCKAEEWQRDGRGLWAMRFCVEGANHGGTHQFCSWRYYVSPPLVSAPASAAMGSMGGILRSSEFPNQESKDNAR